MVAEIVRDEVAEEWVWLGDWIEGAAQWLLIYLLPLLRELKSGHTHAMV